MACGYAYAILSDFHLAEDAAQEVFIESPPRWKSPSTLKHLDIVQAKVT
jgi:DNA-directed RNA polymerase specialized sigma24 family protein